MNFNIENVQKMANLTSKSPTGRPIIATACTCAGMAASGVTLAAASSTCSAYATKNLLNLNFLKLFKFNNFTVAAQLAQAQKGSGLIIFDIVYF